MKPKTSDIWQYFIPIDENYAKCITCNKNYSRKGRTTTSLKGHLKSMHKEKYEEFCEIEEQRQTEQLIRTPAPVTPPQQANKHIRIEETRKNETWDISHQKANKMDNLIGEMIALQNLPFDFVESVGFRRVMEAALPNYQLRGRWFFTDHIDEIYTKMARKVEQLLQQFPMLTFTTDVLSEPNANVSLLSLTAHGITEDFNRMQIILKCYSLHGRHTDGIVCDRFKMMLEEWNIQQEKLHCFIRVGSNMTKAMHLADIPDVSCPVYQLELCVRSALERREVKELIVKCKKMAGHFNNSQKSQDELITIQTEQLNQPALQVIQDCDIRWNSTFQMIERQVKIKDSICIYASKHNIKNISTEEWLHLEQIVDILSPFDEITKNLRDKKTCISSVIPLIHVLMRTLQIQKEKPEANHFKNVIKKLIEDISSRFCEFESNPVYSLATYLDPRYKLKFFNDIIKEQVQAELLRLLMLHDSNLTRATSSRAGSKASAPKRSKIESVYLIDDQPCSSFKITKRSIHSNLADMLTNSSDEEELEDDPDTKSNLMIWKSLINEYNNESRLQLDSDPLMWWKYNTKFQAFATIVRIYFSPPSSVSEELFSGHGFNEQLRNGLDGDKAAKLLFIKHNLPLLNFKYQ